MDQPTPTYGDHDLGRVVARDSYEAQQQEVKAICGHYGIEKWHREPLRVWMAWLKLASKSIAELKKYVEFACQDYRDVLAWAECASGCSRCSPPRVLSPLRKGGRATKPLAEPDSDLDDLQGEVFCNWHEILIVEQEPATMFDCRCCNDAVVGLADGNALFS